MQKVPKDIDFIVYSFIHRDLIKLVNQEYHSKLFKCSCEDLKCGNICRNPIYINDFYGKIYNFRRLDLALLRFHYVYVYTLKLEARGLLPVNY